jgi:peptide/nickel transport system substrate-binding protein
MIHLKKLGLILLVLAFALSIVGAQEDDIPEGGTLVFASGFSVDIFNPVITTEECRSCLWIFDSLVDLAPDMSPAPNLAESWEVTEDGTVFTFKLREDVTWHDGEAFDADDVVFTFDTWMTDEASVWREDFVLGTADDGSEQVVTLEKIDDFTVQFTLPRFDAQFLNKLTGYALIVPEHLLSGLNMAEASEFNQYPIGTGPLIFQEAQSEQYARFDMNKDYWRGRPHLDAFVWAVIPDQDAQVIALSNGEIDVIKNVYGPDMEQRVLDMGDTEIYQLLGNYTRTIFINQEHFAPFQDKLVREAMAYGFDRAAVVNALYGVEGAVAGQMFNPTHWGYNTEARVIEFDQEMAIAKLAEAGWEDTDGDGIVDKDGEPLAFTLIVEPPRAADAQAFQDYMRQIGIDVSIQQLDRAVWQERRAEGEWDTFLGWDGSALPENALTSKGAGGSYQVSDARIDELLAVVSGGLDQQDRIDAAREIVAIIREEVYSLPYSYYQSKIAVKSYVGGLQLPPTTADFQATGVFYHIEDLFITGQ